MMKGLNNMEIIAKVVGVGKYLPEKVVTSERLERELGFEKLGVRKGTIKLLNGVETRRFADKHENSSDLAAKASKDALQMAGLEAESIDLLLFCSISQDFIEPATANAVQYKIGAINARCMDVKNACNAFITGLEVANAYIKSGMAKLVLITAGEVMSRYLKLNYNNKNEIDESNATLGFGDGGGAIILQADIKGNPLITEMRSYGQYWDQGVIWGGGTMYMSDKDKSYMKNADANMVQVNTFRAIKFYYDMLKKYEIDIDDVSLFITTQISKLMIKKCSEALSIKEENIVMQVVELGNTAAASMPIALSRAIESGRLSLSSGKRIVFLGAANGLTIGFATLVL